MRLLQSTESKAVKIAVLNLLLNIAFKESDSTTSEGRARKQIVDMNLTDMLIKLKEKEGDPEVRGYFERALKKLE